MLQEDLHRRTQLKVIERNFLIENAAKQILDVKNRTANNLSRPDMANIFLQEGKYKF